MENRYHIPFRSVLFQLFGESISIEVIGKIGRPRVDVPQRALVRAKMEIGDVVDIVGKGGFSNTSPAPGTTPGFGCTEGKGGLTSFLMLLMDLAKTHPPLIGIWSLIRIEMNPSLP